MSLKNFMSYEDAEEILGEYADAVNSLKSGLTNVNDYLFSSEILSNADLNNYITSASYRIGNIATCTNRPDTTVAGTSGVLEIEAHGQYILQKFYGDIGYTQRISYDGGTTWVAWDSRLTSKQDKTDNTLTTTAKTVVGAINELDTDFSNLLANNLSGLKIKRGYKLNSSDVLTFDSGTYLFITIKPQYSQSAIYALDNSENSPQLIAGKDLSITKTVSDGRITVSFSGSYLRFVLIRVDASVNFADEIHLSVATPTP